MEFDENDSRDEHYGDFVEIYSRNAILWFSILADPLVGGILLIINLWVVGYKKAIAPVVIFLLVFEGLLTTGEYLFTSNFKLSAVALTQNDILYMAAVKIIQVAGGFVLAQYFYKKSFPENDYYPKNILQPLVITLFIIVAMQYYGFSF
jgi:hypothetical protein